jgi:hypothetical protein
VKRSSSLAEMLRYMDYDVMAVGASGEWDDVIVLECRKRRVKFTLTAMLIPTGPGQGYPYIRVEREDG